MSGTATAPRSAPQPRTAPKPARRRGRGIRDRRSNALTVAMGLMLLYTLLPLFWLLVSTTKNQESLFSTFGLWFGHGFAFFHNVSMVLHYQNGIYLRWFGNTVLYSGVGACGAALIATLGGYGLAKYRFRGRNALFGMVLGAIAIPTTALAVPTYLLYAKIGLINTPWAVLLPALASPFGLYLMRVYALDAVPDSMLEAARIDGSGELRTFFTISLRLLAPGFVTVLLFALVSTWNNYFLPLIVLSDPKWYPLTVGLGYLDQTAETGVQATGGVQLYPLILMGSLLAILPLIIAFLFLQRYWQSGLAAGSVKQ
jgi:multiple sugar transport system permease protein